MLIDVHAHFYSDRSSRAGWRDLNARRLEAGERIGVTYHVASVLGTWGRRSPTYFPSPGDVRHANDFLLDLQARHSDRIRAYCVVNPNFTDHALREIDERVGAGMVGVKLAASRRADDALVDPVAALAGERTVPVLHHVWQGRRGDVPGQDASDAVELVRLARRHPGTAFILAHLGGGGDWSHSLRAVRGTENVWVDLAGSGVDVDMVEHAVRSPGPRRLLWGADLTLDTGWAKLRYVETLGLAAQDLARIRHANARAIFPEGAFDGGD